MYTFSIGGCFLIATISKLGFNSTIWKKAKLEWQVSREGCVAFNLRKTKGVVRR